MSIAPSPRPERGSDQNHRSIRQTVLLHRGEERWRGSSCLTALRLVGRINRCARCGGALGPGLPLVCSCSSCRSGRHPKSTTVISATGQESPLTAYAVVALSCLVAGWLVGRWPVLVLAAIPGLVSLLFGYADVPDVDDAGFYFAYRVSKHSLIFTPAFAAMIGLGVALSRLRTWFTRRVAPTA